MREVRQGSAGNEYVTFVRAGEYNPNREAVSEPVSENEGLPKALRDLHARGRGIIIVPSEKPADIWRPMRADERREDMSVMAGPIILKGAPKSGEQMPMVLYLNSPTPDVFGSDLEPYMKCCTDSISLVLNTLAEIILEVRMLSPTIN